MRRKLALSAHNRARYLDQTQVIICKKHIKTCSQVLFARAIYHTPKHLCTCVGICTCNETPLMQGSTFLCYC